MPREARWLILPSLPTALLMRANSLAMLRVQLEDVVQDIVDFAGDAGLIDRQANGEIALLEGDEGIQKSPASISGAAKGVAICLCLKREQLQ